jgi:hypothetical protein
MSKSNKKIDTTGQLSIFDLIERAESARRDAEPESMAGKFDLDKRFRALISEALKTSKYSRYQVAARMSEYLAKTVSKETLDTWTAESKENHRFPLSYLPAFRWACEDTRLMRELADQCGGHYIESEDALLMELGKIADMKKELANREKAINAFLTTSKRR